MIKKLNDSSHARVQKTKFVKHAWRRDLDKLESMDVFKINYSLPSNILLTRIFQIDDTKCPVKSNWDIYKEGLKNRPRSIGMTSKIYSSVLPIASLIQIKGKEYYDFNLVVDVLFKSSGTAGVAFRIIDDYNYYAFYVNKKKGTKNLVKVVNGRKIVLKKIKDGGILMNNWHRINITCKAANIKLHVYDLERPNVAASEKIIEVVDGTFSVGSIGMFVNRIEGFYFDNLIVTPTTCWTPWVPIKNLEIINKMSSVYVEDFNGNISEKFLTLDPDDSEEGPSEWGINRHYSPSKPIGIFQKSKIYDKSSARRPSILLVKDKIISNGIIKVSFTPTVNTSGTISVIFKYFNEKSPSGQAIEMFYCFDMIYDKKNSQLLLKKFSNGTMKEIKSINSAVEGLPALGYQPDVLNKVEIEIDGKMIKIRMSMGGSPMIEVLNANDLSINHGLFGIGTSKIKAVFSNLELFPPVIQLSEADKNKIMMSDNDALFLPLSPGSKTHTLKPRKVIDGMKGGSDYGSVSKKLAGNSSTASIGLDTCISKIQPNDRNNYCERTFMVIDAQENCKKDFCNTCCENSVNKSHGNSLYICKKICNRATVSEPSNDEYKSVCIHSESPIASVYEYCENKFNHDTDAKKICKLDMCNLCCSTMDTIKNKMFSVDSMKNCFKECSREFNK